MANDFYYNGTNLTNVLYNGTSVNVVKYNDTAVWGRPYTLTISTTGTTSAISSYSVSRSTSPNAHASTGTLSTGNTIYYGDTLTSTCSAASSTTSYGSWSVSSLTSPSVSGSTYTVTITNSNSVAVTCYYSTTKGSTTYSVSIAANSSASVTTPTGATYYFFFRCSRSRSKTVTTYSATTSASSLTVDGNETITFTGSSSSSTTTETGTLDSEYAAIITKYWHTQWTGSSYLNNSQYVEFTTSDQAGTFAVSGLRTGLSVLYTKFSASVTQSGSVRASFEAMPAGVSYSTTYSSRTFYLWINTGHTATSVGCAYRASAKTPQLLLFSYKLTQVSQFY